MQSGSSQSSVRYEGGSHILPLAGAEPGEILINDHNVIKRLLQQLCDAEQTMQRKSALELLKDALTVHNAMEESLYYPALEKVGGKKHESQKLYKETAAADVLVFELDTMLKTGHVEKFAALAKELQASVLEHIEDEEKHAIPDLQKHANPQQTQMLLESIRDFRSKLSVRPQ